jgi:hypothetical protein
VPHGVKITLFEDKATSVVVLLMQQYTAQVKFTELENEECGMKRKFTSSKFVTLWLDIGIFFLRGG